MSLKSTFDAQMAAFNLPAKTPLAIAISGGADSMALAHLLKKWIAENNHPLVALTVDHGLRPESAQEARLVGDWMREFGIEHHILTWQGKKPATRIEEKAREARYNLMQDFCKKHQIQYLCLAHHANDQLETFLSRLARGSGTDGLCAMKLSTQRDELTLLRPLLYVDKEQLSALLVERRNHNPLCYVEDPMNQDTTYERVRWRQNLPTLWETGLTKTGILLSTKRLSNASDALNHYAHQFIQNHVTLDNRGFVLMNTQSYMNEPFETRVRVLTHLIQIIGQSNSPLSLKSIENLIAQMPKKTTLGDCHIIPHKRGIFIAKEFARIPSPITVPAHKWIKWDRFKIYSKTAGIIKAQAPSPREANIPFLVQQSFPHFFLEKKAKLDYKEGTPYIETHIDFIPPK